MKNLTRAIGLEAIYQDYLRLVPGYIDRAAFFVEMRKALRFKNPNLVLSSAN